MNTTKSYRGSGRPANRRARRRLELEPLESRELLAVTAVGDIGAGYDTDEDVPLVVNSTGNTALVAPGSDWNYLSTSLDIGSSWRQPAFDDSSWLSGPARLGYGDPEIVTELSWGPTGDNAVDDPAFKNITYRFRHDFNVADASLISGLTLNLLRDDGALVFINGELVVADGVAPDAEGHTLAIGPAIDGANEDTFFPHVVNPLNALGNPILVTGNNVIAVELHQVGPGSSDIGLDVELLAPSISPLLSNDDLSGAVGAVIAAVATQPVDSVSGDPAGTVVMDAGGNFTFTPAANYFGTATFTYSLVDDDNNPSIGTVTMVVASVNDPPTITSQSFDAAEGGGVDATLVAETAETVLGLGGMWSYLDDGTDQGSQWFLPAFNDASWATGPAQLGYGEDDEATVIQFGGDPANKFTTSYFRNTFDVAGAPSTLFLDLLRDDGAAVYINGVEVVRDNLAVAAAFDTLATGNAPDDGRSLNRFVIDTAGLNLQPTGNTIAAEVHQSALTSSDASFDLRISTSSAHFGLGFTAEEVEGETFDFQLVDSSEITPAVGTLIFNPNGTFDFAAAGGDVSGVFAFTFTATDASGTVSPEATVTLNVVPADDGPIVAVDDAFTAAEDTAFVIDVASGPTGPLGLGILANDTTSALDVGDPIVITIVDSVLNGTLVLAVDGSMTYTPNPNFIGTDTFTYTVNDGFTESNLATVTITVDAVNDAPVALDDTAITFQGQPITTVAGQAPTVYIPLGATWNYLDNGSDQGGLDTFEAADTTWFASPGYDASAWKSGPAELGYGDTDHVTEVLFGPDPDNANNPIDTKYTTSYYRTAAIDIPNSATVGFLALDLVADDGAAVYINGVEVYRTRLAADAAFGIFGANAAGDGHPADQALLDVAALGIPLLDTGNIIAVEIHQAALTSSDSHFDLQLASVVNQGVLENDSDEESNPFEIVGVDSGPNGGTVVLNADGSYTYTPLPEMVGIDTFVYRIREVGDPAITATATVSITVLDTPDAPIAGTDSYFQADPTGILNVTAVTLADVVDTTVLIPLGDTWNYLDDGSDQGTAWKASGFDDSGWTQDAAAQLGYGEGDEATEVRFGADPDNTLNDPDNKFVTTYFRNSFPTAATISRGADDLYVSLIADDGAVVYLNGTEVVSTLLLDNPAFDQLAYLAEPGDGQVAQVFEINSSLLNPAGGADNVLAVEVHQSVLNSSDLSFDVELLVANDPVGVLVNDSDPEFGQLTAVVLVPPANADAFTLNADGTFDYDPVDSFLGTDTFTYTLSDGTGLTSVGTVNIVVGTPATLPPQVLSFGINSDKVDNPPLPKGVLPSLWAQQRSEIFTLVVTFDQDVTAGLNDLVLTNLGKDVVNDPRAVVDLAAINATAVAVGSTLTVTFEQNTLADGGYSLEVRPTVQNQAGQALDGNGDGTGGDSYVVSADRTNKFYRLLSEYTGDFGVSVFDFSTFSYWFGAFVGTGAGEAPAFVDTSFDGGVSVFDFSDFSENFGEQIVIPVAFAGRVTGELPADAVTVDLVDDNNDVEQIVQQDSILWRNDIRNNESVIALGDDTDEEVDELLDLLAADVGEFWQ